MLDIKLIRNNPHEVAARLQKRGEVPALDALLLLDEQRRVIIAEVEQLKNLRNEVSRQIARVNAEGPDAERKIREMQDVSRRVKDLDNRLKDVEEQIDETLLGIPNTPHSSVPPGTGEGDNREVHAWGKMPELNFPVRSHWEIGEALNILDMERATKVTGARFTFYRGYGARLERALINFMLDLHATEHGYTEIWPPFLVHSRSMVGTGQLPKFADDMFRVEGTEYFLIPTAEVPVTNLYRDEILDGEALPVRHVAYSACFRAEAGAHGKDTRGLIRQHQFNKVELVQFARPEESYENLEQLTRDAEIVLERLGLPYRRVVLCGGDLGFSAAKTYDLEVWFPSVGGYREISSCSNFEDYQARRAGIRFRPEPKAKPRFVHTLNGSGLAVGRTLAAILENYQCEDGTVVVPEALRPYMGIETIA